MKVQFNLLPDVKQQYIESERTRRTVATIAFLVTAISVAIFAIMLSVVYGVNKVQLKNADNGIKTYQNQLNQIPNLGKILTVQNQLASLLSLHQQKHASSRLFTIGDNKPGYLTELTPTNVSLGQVQVDFVANTMQISGTADSQKTINTFVDTLKFTTYQVDGKDTGKNAFPSVIESSFGIDQKGANYGLTIQFDPALFNNSSNTTLKVPDGLVTTRSVVDDPSNILFNGENAASDSTTTTNTTTQQSAGNQ